MHRLSRAVALLLSLAFLFMISFDHSASAAERKTFKIGYIVYVGFMPLNWMKTSGMMKKWADKYGIDVELVQLNDYVAGMNQFIAGDIDAYGVAGMDALVMPAAGGVDTSMFLITDYSNGNDAIVSKTAKSVADLAGKEVHLLQFSVSHYLLNRALVLSGLAGVGAVKTVNISDSEIAAAFITQPEMEHAVSWKPMIPDMVKGAPGSQIIFDSSKIPGEIMDMFIAKTATLKDSPELAKAMTGAWYETLATLKAGGAKAGEIETSMAEGMGTDKAGLKAQTDTTHFFETPADALAFLEAAKTTEIWDYVRRFCFDQGLFGQGADSVDAIGIEMADGAILGSDKNVKMRVNTAFAKMGADGKL